MYTYIYMFLYIHTRTHVCICMYIYTYIYIYIHILYTYYIYNYISIDVCLHDVYIYIYIYTTCHYVFMFRSSSHSKKTLGFLSHDHDTPVELSQWHTRGSQHHAPSPRSDFRKPVGPKWVKLWSMDWFCWENLNRKPWFLPSNIGLSCKFSHHPILWFDH